MSYSGICVRTSAPRPIERAAGCTAEEASRWYVVHTKPLAEARAERHLQRQGYATYLPRLAQTARRCQRWTELVVPLFPRYLFLQLDALRQSLRPVHSTVGVSGVVRFGTRCAMVGDEIVAALRAREDQACGLHRLKSAAGYARGTRVRITAGPFCGIDGIFERADGEERVLILLQLLGHETAVRFPTELVVRAAF
jgi:transcriptional antiterminator RfaH